MRRKKNGKKNILKKMYDEERKLRERIEEERNQAEYDKNYFANEVSENREREIFYVYNNKGK